MGKIKENHIIPGANAQGKETGFNEEFANEPLTEAQKEPITLKKTPNSGSFYGSISLHHS